MLADSKNYDWLVTEDFIRNIKNVRDAAEAELGKFSKRGGVVSGIGWLIDICMYIIREYQVSDFFPKLVG